MKRILLFSTALILISAASICYPIVTDNTLTYNGCNGELKVDTSVIATKHFTESSISSSLPYSAYIAVLYQTGENAPEDTVLFNTLSDDVVWSYFREGTYTAEINGGFDPTKTICYFPPNQSFGDVRIRFDGKIQITVFDESYTPINDGLSYQAFEIRVYP